MPLCLTCRQIHDYGECRMKQRWRADRKNEYEKQRTSRHKRGYDRVWEKFRSGYFAQPENWRCHECGVVLTDWQEGQGSGRELHHIVPISVDPTRRLDITNVEGLCKMCHSRRPKAPNPPTPQRRDNGVIL